MPNAADSTPDPRRRNVELCWNAVMASVVLALLLMPFGGVVPLVAAMFAGGIALVGTSAALAIRPARQVVAVPSRANCGHVQAMYVDDCYELVRVQGLGRLELIAGSPTQLQLTIEGPETTTQLRLPIPSGREREAQSLLGLFG